MRKYLILVAGMMLPAVPIVAHADDLDDAFTICEHHHKIITSDTGPVSARTYVVPDKFELGFEKCSQIKETYDARQKANLDKIHQDQEDAAKVNKSLDKSTIDTFPAQAK